MAQRRPTTSHPAFAPLLALWFAALFGLAVAVLPAPLLERTLAAAGLGELLPLTTSGRLIASGGAALVGAVLGLALGSLLRHRGLRDPRPTYSELEFAFEHPVAEEPIRRRPLHVREELAEGVAEETGAEPEAEAEEAGEESARSVAAAPEPTPEPAIAATDEGFMILTPQPIHPPRPAPDLEGLLEQFDTALAAFRSGDEERPPRGARAADPVHAFVARQTGTPAPSALGGRMPDHQAELRAALDKLARAHRKD